MKKSVAFAAVLALGLSVSACSAQEPESTPAPTVTVTAPSEAEQVEQIKEVFTQPDVAPVHKFDPEQAFLATYQDQLATLPEGPFEQLGTDEEAINLGYSACYDLSIMSYGESLLSYAFMDETTEAMVADYNAALNAAPGTLC